MKTYLLTLLVFSTLILGCNNSKQGTENKELQNSATLEQAGENTGFSEWNINKQVADTIDGGMMLLGPINAQGLNQEPYSLWFEENTKAYTPDMTIVEEIKPLLKSCYIKVFMGTWCEDSQREVPALMKLLNLTEFDQSQIEIIAMTHDKDTPENYEADYEIEFIPTIMIFKDGAELNRIVEYTQETMELDLLKILKQQPYTPAYAE
ncbi:thioredoxin family protein [Flavobacteriaceae bacterium]|nr:thioredoxin family protein [Flavobacteriaceae bacterium]